MTDIQVRIISVDLHAARGHWRIGQEVDDGSGTVRRELHVIPQRAVVEHAAEYGLDPGDSRQVIDWLLHERFVRRPDPDPGPRCPYRNPPATAWAAYQADIARVKSEVSIVDPDGYLERIHRSHRVAPEHWDAARQRVAQVRQHVAHTDMRLGNG